MNFLKSVATIWHREIIRYFRDRSRIYSSLFQAFMFLAIMGYGLRSSLASSNFGADFIQFMYPGVLVIGVMAVAFFATVSTVFDREFGFLKEILVAPISRTSIVLGKAFGATTVASMQALLLLIIAPFIHVQIRLVALPQIIFFLLLVAFAVSAIGLFVSSRIKSTESFGFVMSTFILPMYFLSGAFFPLNAVPKWMSVLASFNPLVYGVDALRIILLRPQLPAEALKNLTLHSLRYDAFFLILFSGLLISLAVWAFNRKN